MPVSKYAPSGVRIRLALFPLALAACSGTGHGNGNNDRYADLPDDCIEWVDPFHGTGGEGFSTGQVTPSACRPFGPVRVGPSTSGRFGAFQAYHFSGYYYPDEYSFGISHVRMSGIGANDQGNVLVQPVFDMDASKTRPADYKMKIDKDSEKASPGYYEVDYADGISIKLTATHHAAFHAYTYAAGRGRPCLLIDSGFSVPGSKVEQSEITLDPESGVFSGKALNKGGLSGRYGGLEVYFHGRIHTRITDYGSFGPGRLEPGSTAKSTSDGKNGGVFACFDGGGQDLPVLVEVGISYVDEDGAKANLEAESADFDLVKADAEAEWQDLLCRVKVAGGTDDQRKIFYSSLFHALTMPTMFNDADSRYKGFDGNVHEAAGFTYYTDFSLWDTFRTEHPLLSMLYPEFQADMLKSLVLMYEQGGAMPRWPQGTGYTGSMLGSHADAVFADSLLREVNDFPVEKAYEGMKATATGPVSPVGRGGIEEYISLGYVAADREDQSVSKTLEYSFDDYCVSVVANRLGLEDDREVFLERSRNYKNLYDPGVGFFRGRNSDGSWIEQDTGREWDPLYFSGEFAEGNAWQYFWFVPHDVEGLAKLSGGNDALLAKLEEFFEKTKDDYESGRSDYELLPRPYYWHGNEPDIHAAFLFSHLGRTDLASRWVHWILEHRYGPGPDGIPGNDDCGTMGAWYVLSAIGLYPVVCTGRYYVTVPLFDRISLDVNGKRFLVVKTPVDGGGTYIRSINLNKEPLDEPFLAHQDLVAGGMLEIVVAPRP